MATEIVLPKLSLTMSEGSITKWIKNEGDSIKKGEPLLEVMTDKVNVTVESPADGVLYKILKQNGESAKVFEKIGYIVEPDEEFKGEEEMKECKKAVDNNIVLENKNQETSVKTSDKSKTKKVAISPAAKRTAKENGLDLEEIKQNVIGSGPQGRIIHRDIDSYLEEKKKAKLKVTPTAKKVAEAHKLDLQDTFRGNVERVKKVDVYQVIDSVHKADSSDVEVELIPLTGLRKTISERMSYSYQNAPQVTLTTEVDMKEAVELYNRLKTDYQICCGGKITYTDLIVKVVSIALKQFPQMNSKIEGENIKRFKHINIGIAIAIDEGLLVPVIKNCDKKLLGEISSERKNLVEKARTNRLSPEEMSDGTFTITNLGSYDIDMFTPIINPPETAILGIGRILKKPVVVDDEICIRPMMFLSLTFDHRIVDGAPAADFLKKIKQILENPFSILV